jgi:hypothetical protein
MRPCKTLPHWLPVPDCDLDHRNLRVKTTATEDCFFVFAGTSEAVVVKCGQRSSWPWKAALVRFLILAIRDDRTALLESTARMAAF